MRNSRFMTKFVPLLIWALIFVPGYSADKKRGNQRETAGSQLLTTDRHPRPVPMGISISTTPSSPIIFAGTAGLFVRSLTAPNLKFILSNNHVMAAAPPNLCPNTAPNGTWILQPGTLARIDHRFGNEGDFGRPERFSESFAIDPVQVE